MKDRVLTTLQLKVLPSMLRLRNKFIGPRRKVEALIERDGEVLVLDTEGHLFLPGGRVESHETYEESAVREVREETGLEVEVLEKIGRHRSEVGDKVTRYRAEPQGDQKLSGSWEGQPRWISKAELDSFNTHFEPITENEKDLEQ